MFVYLAKKGGEKLRKCNENPKWNVKNVFFKKILNKRKQLKKIYYNKALNV